MGIIDIDNKYVAHSYGRYPVCITHGKGSVVYDENNKKYIDFGTGIAVNLWKFPTKYGKAVN